MLWFHFYYSDGTIQPDPEAEDIVLVKDLSQFEIPEVSVWGWHDLFDIWLETADEETMKNLEEADINNIIFPSFFLPVREAIENATDQSFIPIHPTELQPWAEMWHEMLIGASPNDRVELLPYNYATADDIIQELVEVAAQAKCAQQHGVGIVLRVSW